MAGRNAGNALLRWSLGLFVLIILTIPILEASRPSGIYWSKVEVIFYPPGTASGGNPMRSDSLGIVPYAALVERLVDGHHQRPLLETTGAALYGSGIRQGYAMYLPNAGGQWQTQFNRAAISVEVVGESEVEVRELQTKLVERITVTADERQASMGVAPTAYITTSLSPESPEVHFHATHPLHAAVALGLLAVGFSIVAGRMLNDVIIRRATSENSRNPAMTS